MKRFITTLLSLAAVLVLAPAALAAEEITIISSLPELITQEDRQPGDTHLLSLEGSTWERSWTCYKDQLTGDALIYYQAMETVVCDDTFRSQDVKVTNSKGEIVYTPCWMETIGTFVIDYEYVDSSSPQQAYSAWYKSARQQLDLACDAFVLDHPECFWIRYNHVAVPDVLDKSKEQLTVALYVGFMKYNATDDESEIRALQKDIDAVLNTLAEATEAKTDLGKLKFMDNWLAEHNHYNMKAATDAYWLTEQDETPWSIVGGLLDDYSPVCEGYSKAFQLFCHKNNIPCLQVTGTANGGAHMWNYVQYAGEWYLCDTTWDDPLYMDKSGNLYDKDKSSETYFMISSAEETSADDSMKHTAAMDFLLPNLATKKPDFSCANGHTYNDWTETKAPTCTDSGEESHACTLCGHTEVRDLAALGHDYTSVVTDPTCIDLGYTTYTCTRCGDSYTDNFVETSGHSFKDNICKHCGLIGGTCGEGLTWTLVDGVLSICGAGDMTDYGAFSDDAPWYNTYKDEIRKLVIEDGVTSIGEKAFRECTNLTEIQLPESLSVISAFAFMECTSIERVTIPEGVTKLVWGAFIRCTGLKEITLPDSLRSVEARVFEGCTSLNSVTIPSGVTSISDSFPYCTSLVEILVDSANKNYTSTDGVLYEKDLTTLVCYPAGRLGDHYEIVHGVKHITNYAFSSSQLKTISIPDSVRTVGRFAFEECCNLIEIKIPDGVETIQWGTFYGCTNLNSITLPESVTSIEFNSFFRCYNLSAITFDGDFPDINSLAFWYSVATIYYPCNNESWTTDKMQQYGGSLAWVPNHQLDILTEGIEPTCSEAGLSDRAYCSVCDTTFEQEPLPQAHSFVDSTCVHCGAFGGTCGATQQWIYSDHVLTVSGTGDMMDYNFEEFPWHAKYSTEIYEVVIKEGVTSIGSRAFYEYQQLTKVTLPDTLTTIGYCSFTGCTSLSEIRFPASVTVIDECSFMMCFNLDDIYFAGNAPTIMDYAFANVSAIVHYPCSNKTWAEDTRLNYNGDLTWKGYGHTFTTYTADEECHCQIAYCDNGCGEADVKFEEEATGSVEDNKITWTEYSAGNVLVVLYDEHGRMIDMKYCEKTVLKTAGSIDICLFTLDFSPAKLASAHKILSFNFNEGWIPIRNFKSVS